jgi:hypothetical protein
MHVGNSSVAIGLDNGGVSLGARMAGHPATMARSVAEMAEHVRTHFGVDRFDAWVQSAQPGARQIYGVGIHAASAAGPGVARRMRALSEVGLVRLHNPRVRRDPDYPFDFIAVRTSKPVPKSFPLLAGAASDDQRAAARAEGKGVDAWLAGAR